MFSKAGLLVVIFLCGYLTIQWVTITHPFILADFFISLVVNPLQFFVASMSLFIGVLCLGGQMRTIHRTIQTQKKFFHRKWLLYLEFIGLIIVFLLLFQIGWEQTLVFLSFGMMYGMISVKH